ncbi:MAG: GGDEF domain-containing protein, partial [Acidimicrobiia bacterium]|nr:GGDEF domain-containing protein [Acidimicrobiia bacterium]
MAGAILLLVMPGWTVFDAVHEPQRVEAFLALRVGTEVAAVAVWALLWHRRIGLRRSEPLVLLLLSLPVVAVAWMVADVGEGSLEAYLLGFTLPLYGSAFLLVWRWQLTAVLVAIAVGALAAALLTGPRPTTRAELTTMAFFVGTSATVAVIGQAYRQRLSWREFSARSALEREQTRTGQLLAELERLSREDGLTGLANRRCWDGLLAQRLEQARRSGEGLAVLLCDVDHFKEVNDAGGHARGDAVLRALAECFAARVRGTD